jgi:hypothetical protein
MLRKLGVLTIAAMSTLGLIGTGTAHAAVRLPAGDGAASCALSGTVKVAKAGTTGRVQVSGSLSGCTYNGVSIPFVAGTSRSIAPRNAARTCAAIAAGGTVMKTVTKLAYVHNTLLNVTLNLAFSPVTPSGAGSALSLDGTVTAAGASVTVHAALQSDRPLGDLCNGARSLGFSGTASATWTRA